MAEREPPATPAPATGHEARVPIVDRTAEDEGAAFVLALGAGMPAAARGEARRLFGELLSPSAVAVDNRPRGAEGNVIEHEADPEAAAGKGPDVVAVVEGQVSALDAARAAP